MRKLTAFPPSKRTGYATGLTALLLAAVASVTAQLIPETSPVARGAGHAASHRCTDTLCRDELLGAIACENLADGVSCADISAYWAAIRLRDNLTERLKAAPLNKLLDGERLAGERNCFRCHGVLGQGGFANIGAFKGYIPGYFGSDFRALTNGGERKAVREWIVSGQARSVTEQPLTGFIARFFIERQAVSMPSFSSLPAMEIESLTDYVIALNRFGPLDTQGLTRYACSTAARCDDEQLHTLADVAIARH